jgi:phosphoenolpyruvate---glycerone phosphotransferase subunit DhaL
VGRPRAYTGVALGSLRSDKLISEKVMDAATITSWMREIEASVRAERDHLVQLDAAIGDGDHGTNMTRGFEAVVQAFAEDGGSPPGKLLILAGRTLVSTVGGASGPLWGSALRAGGRTLGDEPTFEAPQLVDVLAAALASVKDLGTASLGDKTMVDALEPAVDTLRQRVAQGMPLDRAIDEAAAAAEAGMRATIPLQARKGRASYLGERSVGHQDPGATSTALMVRALQRAVTNKGS